MTDIDQRVGQRGNDMNVMTPSEAHDSAYGRPPEHDQTVVEVYEFLKGNGCPFTPTFTPEYDKEARPYDGASVECEKMYVGQRTFFADLAITSWSECTDGKGGKTKRYYHHLILEIKPKIYSAGAVLRQVKTQKVHIDKWCEGNDADSMQFLNRDKSWATVLPVFCAGDTLINLYDRMIESGDSYFVWSATTGLRRVIKKVGEPA